MISSRTHPGSGRRAMAARQMALERAGLENHVQRTHAALMIRDERTALLAARRRAQSQRRSHG